MEFDPAKSELIHFTRTRRPRTDQVRLAGTTIIPTESTRFLGVWLDRKLNFKSHLEAVKKKISIQRYALCRIAAKTWGIAYARAREVYTKAIRSAMVYGCAIFHKPADPSKVIRGIAKEIGKIQAENLRIVCGGYKATPIRHLETETFCPPIDLYMNGRLADFENRLDRTGKRELINNINARVAGWLHQRQRRRPRRGRAERPLL